MIKPLVLSTFPGIGMLDLAFEAEGFTTVRGPDVIWGGDIRRFHPPSGVFDGIIGGPPCQAFSLLANLVQAKGLEPRFGNLIPEFERCVAEARPRWFLMENVPSALVPVVDGYAVTSFLLEHSHLPGDDGFGQEQMRCRRFSFGLRGAGAAPDLSKRIPLAALVLPKISPAVLADQRAVPVAMGGSGKLKRGRVGAVIAKDSPDPPRGRKPCVSSEKQRGPDKRKGGGHLITYSLPEMCRLQGLPEDFLDHAPFTVRGKRKLVANGVPIVMGRAVAKAIAGVLVEGE